jgi:hypothetical protein
MIPGGRAVHNQIENVFIVSWHRVLTSGCSVMDDERQIARGGGPYAKTDTAANRERTET